MLREMVALVVRLWESCFVTRLTLPIVIARLRKLSKQYLRSKDCRGIDSLVPSGLAITLSMLIAMTSLSCGLLKHTKKGGELEKHSSSKDLNVRKAFNNNNVKESNSLLLRRDSGIKTFQVRIWPKGMFTFTLKDGFEGVADSIAWSGNREGIHTTSLQRQSGEKNNTAIETLMEASSDEKAIQKKTTIESWLPIKWVLVGILVLILVTWYMLRRVL